MLWPLVCFHSLNCFMSLLSYNYNLYLLLNVFVQKRPKKSRLIVLKHILFLSRGGLPVLNESVGCVYYQLSNNSWDGATWLHYLCREFCSQLPTIWHDTPGRATWLCRRIKDTLAPYSDLCIKYISSFSENILTIIIHMYFFTIDILRLT